MDLKLQLNSLSRNNQPERKVSYQFMRGGGGVIAFLTSCGGCITETTEEVLATASSTLKRVFPKDDAESISTFVERNRTLVEEFIAVAKRNTFSISKLIVKFIEHYVSTKGKAQEDLSALAMLE